MQRFIIGGVALIAAILLGACGRLESSSGGGDPTPPPSATPLPSATPVFTQISIISYFYLPSDLTLPRGTTVQWNVRLAQSNHSTTSDTGLWDSGVRTVMQPYNFTFSTPGVYGYHCTLHPTMRGTITVTNGLETPTPTVVLPPTPTQEQVVLTPVPTTTGTENPAPTVVFSPTPTQEFVQITPVPNATATEAPAPTMITRHTQQNYLPLLLRSAPATPSAIPSLSPLHQRPQPTTPYRIATPI